MFLLHHKYCDSNTVNFKSQSEALSVMYVLYLSTQNTSCLESNKTLYDLMQ